MNLSRRGFLASLLALPVVKAAQDSWLGRGSVAVAEALGPTAGALVALAGSAIRKGMFLMRNAAGHVVPAMRSQLPDGDLFAGIVGVADADVVEGDLVPIVTSGVRTVYTTLHERAAFEPLVLTPSVRLHTAYGEKVPAGPGRGVVRTLPNEELDALGSEAAIAARTEEHRREWDRRWKADLDARLAERELDPVQDDDTEDDWDTDESEA